MMNQQVRGGLVYNVGPGVEQLHDNLYHIEISADKRNIAADGIDQAIVKVRVLDYLGNVQKDGRTITFDLDGTITQVQLNPQGEATIPVKRSPAGTAHVKTAQADGMTRDSGLGITAQ